MKVFISILLSLGLALCEVPPPYPPRGFRPSPPFNLPIRQPQTSYGVPQAVPSKISQAAPQIQYGVPNQQGSSSTPILTPNFNSKQTVPSTSYGVPVTTSPYRTIISESQGANSALNQQGLRPLPNLTPNFNSKQVIPSNSYGAPATSSPYRTIVNQPQLTQDAPSSQNRLNNQYGVPDARNVETLEQLKQLNLLLQLSQSSNADQQRQADINLAQFQNSNRNVGIPNQQYLPVREAADFRGNLQPQNSQQNIGPNQGYLPAQEPTNFRNGFDVPQSNNQDPLEVRIPNPNLQKLSQQYLPVKEASNFDKGVQFPQAVIPQRQNVQPNINYDQPLNNPQLFNRAESSQNNQPQLSGINPNIALASQNPNRNINSYEAPLQSNVDIQQLNVRRLQNSNNVQSSIRQNAARPIQPVQQNREFDDSNIQGASREQVDEKYLPPTTTARTVLRPDSGSAVLPQNNPDEDEQSTESKEEAGGPNIAVATAVSGVPGGQSFYLLQPDGRLQRVIYQKTRAEGDRENEYTANYLFQNIQADPSLVYSPLVALGKR
ncbi:uncharacterized protein LOC108909505 [Anoplophora glabripennis]|uniref:uncharacterized protein LOC108909505 n=1 Tax=Anoplophora glabripennis TaxID=217634 RepID=UPI000873EEC2|nr:uncharacterized protein LOC108909505 [Anoplophora glabripennis]XP_018569388.1 uncharacterized protein LOC108909505 [Anoplophora glabripennis]